MYLTDIRAASFLQIHYTYDNWKHNLLICVMFSTNVADHLLCLAALYSLKEANLRLLKVKCYSEDVNSLQLLST